MTLPERERTRKSPKVRRRGLFLPWLLMILLVIGWSIGWFWLKGEALGRMDSGVDQLRRQGYEVAWQTREVSGFPFRLDVNLTGAHIAEPSGWALSANEIKAEAWIYRLDHWVAVAPVGVTLTRPEGGPVTVRAKALRASLGGMDQRPPKLSIEGVDLRFDTPPGAKPYFVESAKGPQLHLRPGPNDQGAVMFKADGARLRLTGLPARVAQNKPVSILWDLNLARMAAFKGGDWPEAVRNWRDAGGVVTVREVSIRGGDALLTADGGPLRVSADGYLQGELAASLKDNKTGTQAIGGTVSLQDGKATLGPLAVGPAPRLY